MSDSTEGRDFTGDGMASYILTFDVVTSFDEITVALRAKSYRSRFNTKLLKHTAF